MDVLKRAGRRRLLPFRRKSKALIAPAPLSVKTSTPLPLNACCISVAAEDALPQVPVTLGFFLLFLFVSNCQPLPAKLKQREGQDFLWHDQALPPSPCQRRPPHRKPGVILKEDALDAGTTRSESAIRFLQSTIWSLLFGQGLRPDAFAQLKL